MGGETKIRASIPLKIKSVTVKRGKAKKAGGVLGGCSALLDIESIRVLKPGKYELDIVHLFKKDPLIIKLEEGKYMIDLPQAFKDKE